MDEPRPRRRSPRAEKAADYRARRLRAEDPHGFRKVWPRTKATAQRSFRRTSAQRLHAAEGTADLDAADDAQSAVLDARRRVVRKWGSPTLGELVEWHRERQIVRTAWNFFKNAYDPARHREPFAAFLASAVQGRTATTGELARLLAGALPPPPAGASPYDRLHHFPPRWDDVEHRAWLAAFLADEPTWRPRLERWIDEVA
jgi:hypothetical protein